MQSSTPKSLCFAKRQRLVRNNIQVHLSSAHAAKDESPTTRINQKRFSLLCSLLYLEYGRAKCMYCVELKLKVRRVARERYHQRHCGPVSNLNEHLGVVAALHKFGRRRTSRRVNVALQNDRIKQLESAEFLTECGGTGRHSRGLFLRRSSVHGPIQIQNSFLKTFIPINFFQFFLTSS